MPKLSVIVPVYREESNVNILIEDIGKKCPNSDILIIIVDGDPQLSTLNAITGTPRNILKISSPKGRARQMNAGASAADGDILLFLHADSRLPENALQDICSVLKDYDIIAGAFGLKLDSDDSFLKFISYTATERSKITKIPLGDQAIFIRRDYFNSIGGFKDIPLMEDTEIMKRIKKKGGKIKILNSSVVSSARKWQKEGILFNTVKNHLIRFLYSVGVSPDTLYRIYYGR